MVDKIIDKGMINLGKYTLPKIEALAVNTDEQVTKQVEK
jgi:hypothetical protein